jgi:hypothetical protein
LRRNVAGVDNALDESRQLIGGRKATSGGELSKRRGEAAVSEQQIDRSVRRVSLTSGSSNTLYTFFGYLSGAGCLALSCIMRKAINAMLTDDDEGATMMTTTTSQRLDLPFHKLRTIGCVECRCEIERAGGI